MTESLVEVLWHEPTSSSETIGMYPNPSSIAHSSPGRPLPFRLPFTQATASALPGLLLEPAPRKRSTDHPAVPSWASGKLGSPGVGRMAVNHRVNRVLGDARLAPRQDRSSTIGEEAPPFAFEECTARSGALFVHGREGSNSRPRGHGGRGSEATGAPADRLRIARSLQDAGASVTTRNLTAGRRSSTFW
jgi:hypothetical protein